MKKLLTLEYAGLFLLFCAGYFYQYPGSWGIFLALFFVPDAAFLLLFVSRKASIVAYNCLHHQGLLCCVVLAGMYLHQDGLVRTGLIFLAHSSFDRLAGYGLKYTDSLDHTHLGWVGKSKHLNQP